MSALRLINETTASSVSSLTVTDIFSADFDIYKITIGNDNTTNNVLKMRFVNASGSVIATSNYDYANLQLKADTTFGEDKNVNFTELRGLYEPKEDAYATVYIFNPYSNSSYTFRLNQQFSYYNTAGMGGKGIGVLKKTDRITGIHLFKTGSDFTDITVRTYGLRVDS